MTIAEAINILGVEDSSVEAIQKAHRAFILRFHPDRNPNGLEMCKLGNAARDLLMKSLEFLDTYFQKAKQEAENFCEIPEELDAILSKFRRYPGLTLELCGLWIWISGSTKLYKDDLKNAGCKWASKKLMWYFAPVEHRGKRHKPLEMSEIRQKYGSRIYEKDEDQAVNF